MLRYVIAMLAFIVPTSIHSQVIPQDRKSETSKVPCMEGEGAIEYFLAQGYKIGSYGYVPNRNIVLMYNVKTNKLAALSIDNEKSCLLFIMDKFNRV